MNFKKIFLACLVIFILAACAYGNVQDDFLKAIKDPNTTTRTN